MEFQSLYIEKGLDFSFLSIRKKIFIIHGHDEQNLLILQNILYSFDLKPIILGEYDTFSSTTIIEKFEKIGSKCQYAIALCTPDDLVNKNDIIYLQPRPNVIYEIGWFCGKIGRKRVMILVKEGTNIFSDFQGVIQIRFKGNVKECYQKLHIALRDTKIIK